MDIGLRSFRAAKPRECPRTVRPPPGSTKDEEGIPWWVSGLLYMLQFAAQPIGFLYGVYLVTRGEMDIGSLVFLAGLVGVMADATKSLTTFVTFIQGGLVSAQRVFAVLDQPAEAERATAEPPDLSADIAVEVRGVSFAYPGGKRILDGVSLSVRRGEVVAIAGASGGGKTTLFKLLQDFYDHDSGEILLFGRPISALSRADARVLSAYVPQDSAVFDGTIGENIAFGKPGSGREAIEDAARRAYLHDFILSLPKGYDTEVGERGAQISGGQRQRIAIARAMLKDAPLLLLDEATSALDMEAEAEVMRALEELMKGRTTLIIAHRLSTIKNADRILVMEEGRIAESGDHGSLMREAGAYARLYAAAHEA